MIARSNRIDRLQQRKRLQPIESESPAVAAAATAVTAAAATVAAAAAGVAAEIAATEAGASATAAALAAVRRGTLQQGRRAGRLRGQRKKQGGGKKACSQP